MPTAKKISSQRRRRQRQQQIRQRPPPRHPQPSPQPPQPSATRAASRLKHQCPLRRPFPCRRVPRASTPARVGARALALAAQEGDLRPARAARAQARMRAADAPVARRLTHQARARVPARVRAGHPSPGYGARGKKHLAFWTENLTHMLALQQEFTRCAIDPNIKLGVQVGIEAHDETWRRYTKYDQNFRMEPGPLAISGTAEDPIVTSDGFLHARDTFPHVAHDEVLMTKFIAKEVVYPFRNLFYFTRDGRICDSNPDVQFVQALVNAGGSVEDVMKLMGQAQIVDQYVIGPAEGEEDNEEGGETAFNETQDDSAVSSCEEIQGDEDDAAASEAGDEEELQAIALQEPSTLSEQDQEEGRQDEQERQKLDLAFILSSTSTASDEAPDA